jgi:hypothetical protein
MVRRWYVATSGWMQSRERHDTVHLIRARQLFPDDAEVLFLSGCQQEIYASPMIQAVVRSAVLPTGYRVDVPLEGPALGDAETFFRHALKVNPGLVEAACVWATCYWPGARLKRLRTSCERQPRWPPSLSSDTSSRCFSARQKKSWAISTLPASSTGEPRRSTHVRNPPTWR